MVAAKFEPTENWLPPGYVIKKEGAYKGLSVHIASLLSNQQPKEGEDSDAELEESDVSSVSDECDKFNKVCVT